MGAGWTRPGIRKEQPRSCIQGQCPAGPSGLSQSLRPQSAGLPAGQGCVGPRGNGQGWTERKARLCSQEYLPWVLECLVSVT